MSVAGTGLNLTLVYATVVGNTSISNGPANLAMASGTVVPFGSVIGLPQGGPNCEFNGGSAISSGFNFTDDASCMLGGTGDTQDGDPGLGALAGNGGPTQTRLPQAGSPLVDAIPIGSCQADGAAGITTDQRDLSRPALNGCDVGAVEVQAGAAVPVAAAPRFTG
jgi:hypothetical protein